MGSYDYFGFEYYLSDGLTEAFLYHASKATGRVIIPKSIEKDGKIIPVTGLANGAIRIYYWHTGTLETDKRKKTNTKLNLIGKRIILTIGDHLHHILLT